MGALHPRVPAGLYRAAAAIDPSGGARELADALYGELFGLSQRDGPGVRTSSISTAAAAWRRGCARCSRSGMWTGRVPCAAPHPLPEDESPAALAAPAPPQPPEHARFVALLRTALAAALGRLDPRGRLRLACYYAQGLTLAQIGRTLGEHEATVSRQLARTRAALREDVERQLRDAGLNDAAVGECFAAVAADPGPLDLADLLQPAESKNPVGGRSTL